MDISTKPIYLGEQKPTTSATLKDLKEINKQYKQEILNKYTFLKERNVDVEEFDYIIKDLNYWASDEIVEKAKEAIKAGHPEYLEGCVNNAKSFLINEHVFEDLNKMCALYNTSKRAKEFDNIFPDIDLDAHLKLRLKQRDEFVEMLNYLAKRTTLAENYVTAVNAFKSKLDCSYEEMKEKSEDEIKSKLYYAHLIINKHMLYSDALKELPKTYEDYKNARKIPANEYDDIVNEYKITLTMLNDLYEKIDPMELTSNNIKLLKKLVKDFKEEYTLDLVNTEDYDIMLSATSVIQNVFRIYQTDIRAINALNSSKMVDNMYQLEKESGDGSNIGDDYHSMSELYFNRMVMFDIICKTFSSKAWKSKLHDDGTMFENYFIVGIDTPEGQFTYHYHMKFWDIFTCKEIPNAPKWDGHAPKDISRLYSLLIKEDNNGRN